jgi:acetyltransferase-like isoleucine patch superfamily enzyme
MPEKGHLIITAARVISAITRNITGSFTTGRGRDEKNNKIRCHVCVFCGRSDTFSELKTGNNSFIGDQSVVMANIGQKSIIGAGSVVVKDIPEYSVAAGNPATVIRSRKS